MFPALDVSIAALVAVLTAAANAVASLFAGKAALGGVLAPQAAVICVKSSMVGSKIRKAVVLWDLLRGMVVSTSIYLFHGGDYLRPEVFITGSICVLNSFVKEERTCSAGRGI